LNYPSPIGVADLPNWPTIYGKDISGIALDRRDGTYASQLTIFRAATYIVNTIINIVGVKNSPQEFEIIPSDLYAPNCIVKNVVLAYTAGTLSSFDIQGRDFYSNNLIVSLSTAVTDYKLEFRDLLTNETVHTGTIVDHASGLGAFHLTFTPILSGTFDLHIILNGLHVDSSPYRVSVQPALATHAPSSTIVDINSMVHATGQYLRFIIESRDQFRNLRNSSVQDVYVVTLIGSIDGLTYTAPTPAANKNGTYSASFMFTIAQNYIVNVKLAGVHVKDSPI
jgi:hypothetical protein